MDLEQTCAALHTQNEQLKQENDQLKSLLSIVKSFVSEGLTDITASELKTINEWQTTINERQFRNEMQQTKAKREPRTSSPVDFRALIQSTMNTDTDVKVEPQSSQTEIPPDVTGPERLFGEICFQLDRRILSFVFQGWKRVYGFTLLNITDKVIEVSTHPLTGKVDEGYRHYLTQRFAGLMERLSQLGYKAALHPLFTQFIVNTYGILKERPEENSAQELDFNNPDFLKKQIMTSSRRQLQKDLLLVLTCLCSMAEKDGKPLLLY